MRRRWLEEQGGGNEGMRSTMSAGGRALPGSGGKLATTVPARIRADPSAVVGEAQWQRAASAHRRARHKHPHTKIVPPIELKGNVISTEPIPIPSLSRAEELKPPKLAQSPKRETAHRPFALAPRRAARRRLALPPPPPPALEPTLLQRRVRCPPPPPPPRARRRRRGFPELMRP
uniref:Uncharacterized protein n=1 Tax=Oryza glumipatula TaxID=40148 RepID=A0A0D9Z8G6_9ORYZ